MKIFSWHIQSVCHFSSVHDVSHDSQWAFLDSLFCHGKALFGSLRWSKSCVWPKVCFKTVFQIMDMLGASTFLLALSSISYVCHFEYLQSPYYNWNRCCDLVVGCINVICLFLILILCFFTLLEMSLLVCLMYFLWKSEHGMLDTFPKNVFFWNCRRTNYPLYLAVCGMIRCWISSLHFIGVIWKYNSDQFSFLRCWVSGVSLTWNSLSYELVNDLLFLCCRYLSDRLLPWVWFPKLHNLCLDIHNPVQIYSEFS